MLSGSASSYLRNKLLDHVLRGITFPIPTIYAGLFNVTASESYSGDEVNVISYIRQLTTFGAPNIPGITSCSYVYFPTASVSWGTINGFGLFDSITNGHLLIYGSVIPARTISQDEAFSFPSGSLVVRFY